MARITVEDCLKRISNRFELVMVAAKRAKALMEGETPTLDPENDKPTVVALREIAQGNVGVDILGNQMMPTTIAITEQGDNRSGESGEAV